MKFLSIILWGLLLSFSASAQNGYALLLDSSSVVIKGTSSLHDWESNAEVIQGTSTLTIDETGALTTISELVFNVEVESIKSGKSIMDGKTYGALKAKKHPQILFSLTEVSEITADSIFATGELTIAGKTKTVELAATYLVGEDGSLKVIGSEKILMTDYGMKPPKAMLGTLKTGDEVEVVYNVTYQKN